MAPYTQLSLGERSKQVRDLTVRICTLLPKQKQPNMADKLLHNIKKCVSILTTGLYKSLVSYVIPFATLRKIFLSEPITTLFSECPTPPQMFQCVICVKPQKLWFSRLKVIVCVSIKIQRYNLYGCLYKNVPKGGVMKQSTPVQLPVYVCLDFLLLKKCQFFTFSSISGVKNILQTSQMQQHL